MITTTTTTAAAAGTTPWYGLILRLPTVTHLIPKFLFVTYKKKVFKGCVIYITV